jgi:hypothetical protein
MAAFTALNCSGDINPSLSSAAAIEPGVGWRCILAAVLSGACAAPAFASIRATSAFSIWMISGEHGPA